MRAAQVILGTIAILIMLSAALIYYRERSLVGFNPFVEVILGTVIGMYAYKREVDQKIKRKNGKVNN